MAKYFVNPFGVAGDRSSIPDTSQPSGSVSYTTGFGSDYELNLLTDPSAKPVPRDQSNELYYQITLALQQYQQLGTPNFITSADNLGAPFAYEINARVRYDPGSGFKTYQSLAGSNIALPTDTTKWLVIDVPATGYVIPADIQEQTFTFASDTGSANAVVVATTPSFTPTEGSVIEAKITHNNTGNSTLNANDQGAQTIFKNSPINGSNVQGYAALDQGDLTNGMLARFEKLTGSGWVLQNPPAIDRRILQSNLLSFAALGGTTSAYTATPPIPYLGYSVGGELPIIWVYNAVGTNPGAASLNVSGLGVIPIVTAPLGALVGGEMQVGFMYGLALAATEAILLNPTVSSYPTGFFGYSAVASAPAGWLHCDGTAVSRTTYANLFAVIGTTWGVGDGSTTFNLPPSARRTLIGSGGTPSAVILASVGSLGGEEAHTPTEDEMFRHTHGNSSGGGLIGHNAGSGNTTTGSDLGTVGLTEEGGGDAFNVMQPSMVAFLCIKT